MQKYLLYILLTLNLVHPVVSQSDKLQPITPSNIQNLAIIAQVEPEVFGFTNGYIQQWGVHPDGDSLFVQLNGVLGLYSLDKNEPLGIYEGAGNSRISHMVFNQDGSLLVTSYPREKFSVWNLETGEQIFSGNSNGKPIIMPDNQFIVVQGGNIAHIWSIELQKEVDRWEFNCSRIPPFLDGKYITCTDYGENNSFIQKVYELPTFNILEDVTITYDGQRLLNAFDNTTFQSPDGQRFGVYLYESNEMRYEIINAQTWDVIASVKGERPESRHVINNEADLIAYQKNNILLIRNPLTNAEYMINQSVEPNIDYHFSVDSHYFLTSDNSRQILEIYGVTGCFVQSDRRINMRTDAGIEFDTAGTINVGQRYAVIGYTQRGVYRWWELAVGSWVREDVVEEFGADCLSNSN